MRNILIFGPIVVIVFLLQSYFWVPTYEEQTKGDPSRLQEYITASIGDAAILNPILSADSASSDIESMVFEGLIDRDEDLSFRGRVATSWQIHEEAYFYINADAPVPGVGFPTGEQMARLLREKRDHPEAVPVQVRSTLANISAIRVIPPKTHTTTITERISEEGGQSRNVTVQVEAPSRIKFTLEKVDQDLFKHLSVILGEDYFSSFDSGDYVEVIDGEGVSTNGMNPENILPAVAHNPVVTFHLREGVRFHDGHVLDARDVKFTYEAIMNPKNLSPRRPDYEPVKSVQVVDPLTIKITYKRLYSPALGTWGIGILPEHLLNDGVLAAEADATGADPDTFSLRQSTFNRSPIGCGPFIFHEWKSDQYISLERFLGYWEGPANYHRYTYRVIPDLLTQEMEFYAGTVDSYNVQPHQVDRLSDTDKYQSFSGLSFGYTYIGYNSRRKPFDDPRVRRALGMAINTADIIRYVLYDQGERITGPFVKQTDYYNDAIAPLPYDPEGAVRLLREAGWRAGADGVLKKAGRPFQFTLITNNGNDLRKAVLAIAQDAWRRIGIDVRTDLLEWSVFIQEKVNQGDFDALVLGWSMGIEPDLYQIWHSSQSGPHQLNFVGFKNEKADELIVKIRREYNHRRQVDYCHQLHEIIAEEQPYTFLYVPKWTAVLDNRIVIAEKDRDGKTAYRPITPTQTGSFTFHFNKWIKLASPPDFSAEG